MKKLKNFSATDYMRATSYKISYAVSVILIISLSYFLSGCGEASYFDKESEEIELSDSYSSDSDSLKEEKAEEVKVSEDTPVPEKLYVQVSGAVNSPGVFEMTEGDRVYMALEKAGGLRNDADVTFINQASKLSDGDFIYVYTIDEVNSMKDDPESHVGIGSPNENISSQDSAGKVNINTASKEELMTLPGIGESKADTIISFRNENGSFKSTEDLKNISGIKDGVFSKIKDLITV